MASICKTPGITGSPGKCPTKNPSFMVTHLMPITSVLLISIILSTNRNGGLCGKNSGTIDNCFANTTISSAEDHIGGLCGINSGTIGNCFADTTISSAEDYIGGLIGNNYGNVNDCSTQVNINGRWSIGGLIGVNDNSTIQSCCSKGIITCKDLGAGGLIGSQGETYIVNCYSTCNLSGINTIGGLIGPAIFGKIENCYFAGSVSDDSDNGALVGAQNRPCIITNSYFLDTSGPDNGYGDALTDAQMKTQTSYTNWDFVNDNNGSEDIWFMAATAYPKLAAHSLPTDIYLDGITNMKDYSLFANCYKNNDTNCDLNNDSQLNMDDLTILAQDWLKP